MSSFKAAALSVTNLYKTAFSDQAKARAAGYQDAIDDLLQFLEKENLGLGTDGEGWRIRQWATERLDGEMTGRTASDDEEEAPVQEEADARSSSPEVQRKPNLHVQSSELAEVPTPPRRQSDSSARDEVSQPPPQQNAPHLDTFTFRSQHAYPTNHDRQDQSMELDGSTSTPSSTETVRVLPRHARNSRTNRRENRTINLNLGSGAGNKRKIPFPDFFNINEPFDGQDRKDGGNGNGNGRSGKRGRHV